MNYVGKANGLRSEHTPGMFKEALLRKTDLTMDESFQKLFLFFSLGAKSLPSPLSLDLSIWRQV